MHDLEAMRDREVRWGDASTLLVNIEASESDAVLTTEARQIISIQDVPRVWSLYLAVKWRNVASRVVGDVAIAAFTIRQGLGSGNVNRTVVMGALPGAVPDFTDLTIADLPCQNIDVQCVISFGAKAGAARVADFEVSALIAPYTRLREDA